MAGLVDDLLGVVPRLIDRTREQADLVTRLVARLPCVNRVLGAGSGPVAAPAAAPGDESLAPVVALRPSEVTAGAGSVRPARARPNAADAAETSALPIPGYDELAASQVIPRLEGLGPVELEAVRTYESAHRGRRTILARIGQLQAG